MRIIINTLYTIGIAALIILYITFLPYKYIEPILSWYDWLIIASIVFYYLVFSVKKYREGNYRAIAMPLVGGLIYWVFIVAYIFFAREYVIANFGPKEGLISVVIFSLVLLAPAFVFHIIYRLGFLKKRTAL